MAGGKGGVLQLGVELFDTGVAASVYTIVVHAPWPITALSWLFRAGGAWPRRLGRASVTRLAAPRGEPAEPMRSRCAKITGVQDR
jgi:hypothetical protein